jgi:hypothetical protein
VNRWVLTTLLIGVLVGSGCKGTPSATPSNAPPAQQPGGPPAAETNGEPPEAQPTVVAGDPLAGHQFYGVYLKGQKAGWAEERIERLSTGSIRMSTRVVLEVQRMGAALKLQLTDTVQYASPDAGGAVERFELVEQTGGARAVRRGHAVGGKLKVTVESAGTSSHQTLELPKETAHDTLPRLLVPRVRAAKGVLKTWQFDRQQLKEFPIETTLLSEKQTRISGVPVTVLVIQGIDKTRGITMTNRVTEAGSSLEMTLGPGLRLVLEDEAVAKNPALAVPDLYRLSVVPVDRRLGHPGSLAKLSVRLSGLPKDGVSLVDARQSREGDVVTIRRVPHAELPVEPLSDAQRKRWLEATPFLDHANPVVADAAQKLARGDTLLQRMKTLSRAVGSRLSYTLATAPLTASTILEGGRGDCTEYARVLTAMARSLGVPAREVSGMAYAGDTDPGFAFHAWVEVHVDNRWLALDPTWNQGPVDATHIALSRDDPSAIVGVLGGLKAFVLATE